MHHNDNEFDQFFRDRLRSHSSPVRSDLWRRIHTSIISPVRPFHLLRHTRFIGAGTATAAAVVTVAFVINHYSRIPAAGDHRPATVTRSATPIPSTKRADTTGTVVNFATTQAAVANPGATAGQPAAHKWTAPADLAARREGARGNLPAIRESVAAPGGNSAARRMFTHPGLVTLPAIARTSTPPVIGIRPSIPRARHTDPDKGPNDNRFLKTGYVSLYGSPDFPANHYYTWSYSIGATVTIQFGRHWSGTSGFEYGKVNVPTQVVPPVGPFDTLRAFYWSNYQVPVLIGYTMMLGEYALTVNGGAILNLYFHRYAKGNMPLSSNAYWVFNWPDRDSYGAYLGADIFRPVGHSIRVFAQPYARYSISNYRMFIPQQRFFYGAHLGIRYQL
jgi:hypothetical protein